MNTTDKAMTIKEVAKFLNISNQMVYNLVNNGSLPAFKIGSASRIMYSDLVNYINNQKIEFNSARSHNDAQDNTLFNVQLLNLQKGNFSLKDVSFQLPIGKIMTILGPSGSGKTMLLRSIAGLEKITSGSVYMGDWSITDLSPANRKIGFVFEKYSLFPSMSARKNIDFPLKVRKQDSSIIKNETAQRVSELSIQKEYLNLLPELLPEGMKQLVSIAREKNHPTELLLLDEPMSQLDPQHHSRMRIFIQKIIRDMGKTTIMTFHGPEDALALSDYIGIMDKGELVQFGETWEVYHHPDSLLIMEMLSKLGLNRIELAVKNGRSEPYGIEADTPEGNYTMAFRPEDIRLLDKKEKREGIPVQILSSQLLDGRSRLALCKITGEDKELRLLIPLDTDQEFSILPLKPAFFQG
ncbi:MAG: ATP-binding cassette domain-containing protein [Spirochaetales bacterium]|nr:ATP-binding cassette domain-containing protein [Spirochaetales bacterium]